MTNKNNDNVVKLEIVSSGHRIKNKTGKHKILLPFEIDKGFPKDHFLYVKKLELCNEQGSNPAQTMTVHLKCECGITVNYPEFLQLPHQNISCPDCKNKLVNWSCK